MKNISECQTEENWRWTKIYIYVYSQPKKYVRNIKVCAQQRSRKRESKTNKNEEKYYHLVICFVRLIMISFIWENLINAWYSMNKFSHWAQISLRLLLSSMARQKSNSVWKISIVNFLLYIRLFRHLKPIILNESPIFDRFWKLTWYGLLSCMRIQNLSHS